MAERNVAYVPRTAEDTVDYKPLSPTAVAGLAFALLYVLLLLTFGIAAAMKGAPLFMGGWTLSLPIAGAALSGLGLWQIRRSEGTRAGTALARWGLGLSVVMGLGYLTYQTFTGLAILQQANRFLIERDQDSGFLARLQGNEVDVRTAFLYTLDASERNVRPESLKEMQDMDVPSKLNPKGPLTQFLEHPLARLLSGTETQGAKAIIEPLAVHGWLYDEGAYHIVRGYRITTEEGVFEVGLGVTSIEPASAVERRKWQVNWHPKNIQVVPVSRTDLGIKRERLRQRAAEFLVDAKIGWVGNLIRRRTFEAYLGTQPASNREALRQRAAVVAGTPLTALGGGVTAYLCVDEDQTNLKRLLPGYRPPSEVKDYFGLGRFRIWEADPKALASVREGIAQALAPNRIHQLSIRLMPIDFAPFRIEQGEITLPCQALFTVPVTFELDVRMDIVIELEVVVAAPADLDPAAAEAAQQWRIKSLELIRAWPQMER